MTYKVQIGFIDYYVGSTVDPDNCKLLINSEEKKVGTYELSDSSLVVAFSSSIPYSSKYESYGFKYSLDGGTNWSNSTGTSSITLSPRNGALIIVLAYLRGKSFQIQYKNGDSIINTTQYRYNESFNLRSGPTAPSGKMFQGWEIDGGSYAASQTIRMFAYDVIANAVFVDSSTTKYKITYYGNKPDHTQFNYDNYVENTYFYVRYTPSWTGHIFLGWSISDVLYQVGDACLMPSHNIDAEAQWEEAAKIKYDYLNPSSSITTEYARSGDSIKLRSSPSWDKHTFCGWSINGALYPAGGNFTMPSSGDVLAEAQWSANVIIHYNEKNPGDTDKTDSYQGGMQISLRSKPTYTGYTFLGWKIGETIYPASASFTIPETGDVYAVAQWEQNYNIHYNNKNPGDTDEKDSIQGGTTTRLRSSPSYQYHTFLGWKIGEVTYGAGASFEMPNEDVYAVAQWEISKYTLSFSGLSGWTPSSIDPISEEYGTEITIPSVKPTRSGYRFVSWYFNSTYWQPGESVLLTSNTTASLTSSNTTNVKVTFGTNGGSLPSGSESYRQVEVLGLYGVIYGESQTTPFPTPIRSGYDFVGWFTTSSSTGGKEITESSIVSNPYNHTIYARWNQQKKLRFYRQDGTWEDGSSDSYKDFYFSIGHELVSSDCPPVLRDGYTKEEFLGWWTSSSGGERYDVAGRIIEDTSTQSLYARWVEKRTIRFYATPDNNCSFYDYPGVTYKDLPYTPEQPFGVLPSVYRTDSGYEGSFDGWFSSETNKSGIKYSESSIVPQGSGRLYLYSRWSVPYIFDAAGGKFSDESVVKTQYYFYGSDNGQVPYRTFGSFPESPTRTGYRFLGWFTSSSGGSEKQATDEVPYYTSQTYYAHWEQTATEVTLIFDANGGKFPEGTQTEFTVHVGDTFTAPTAPTWERSSSSDPYHTFKFFSSSNYNIYASITVSVDQEKFNYFLADHLFNAVWNTHWEYRFYTYNGELYQTITYTDGSTFYKSSVYTHPYRPGYDPDGFSPELPADGTAVHENREFTYKYKNVEKYPITFYDYDNRIIQENFYNDGEIVIPPPNPTREGYVFVNWDPADFSPADSSKTMIYATYVGQEVLLTFNPNGGSWSDGSSNIKTIQCHVGEMVIPPGTPTKRDAVFCGWSPNVTICDGEKTYIAQWAGSGEGKRFGGSRTDYVFVKPPDDFFDNSISGDPMPIRDDRGDGTGKILRWEDPIYLSEWAGEVEYWLSFSNGKPNPINTTYADDRTIDISRIIGYVKVSNSETFGDYLYSDSSYTSIVSQLVKDAKFPMWWEYSAYRGSYPFKVSALSLKSDIIDVSEDTTSSDPISLSLYGAGFSGNSLMKAQDEIKPSAPNDTILLSSIAGKRFYDNCMSNGISKQSGTELSKKIPESTYDFLLSYTNSCLIPRRGYWYSTGVIRRSGYQYEWSSSVSRELVTKDSEEKDISPKMSGYDPDFAPGTDVYDHETTPRITTTYISGRAATHNPTSEYSGNETIDVPRVDINDDFGGPNNSCIIFENRMTEYANVHWYYVGEGQKFEPYWSGYWGRWFISTTEWKYKTYLSNGQNFSTNGILTKINSFSFVCDISPFLMNHTQDGEESENGKFLTPLKFFFLIELQYGNFKERRSVYQADRSYPTIQLSEIDNSQESKTSYFYVPWNATYDGIIGNGKDYGVGYQTVWKVSDVDNMIKTILLKANFKNQFDKYFNKYPTTISGCNTPSIKWVNESETSYVETDNHRCCSGDVSSSFEGSIKISIKCVGCVSRWTPWTSIGIHEYS